jgi:hypothetical protein
MKLNRPIFILGAHKSGTSLLRSLLDGHPSLFVIPFETHIFQMASYWVDYRFRRSRPPVLELKEIKRKYTDLVNHYNNTPDPLADSDLVGKIDVSILKRELNVEVSSFVELIILYFRSLYNCFFRNSMPDEIRVVEKSVENAEFAWDLKELFPDAMFIHILRNPYANLVALRHKLRRQWSGYPLIGIALASLNNSYYHLYRNRRLLKDYKVIKYEDILNYPEETMNVVSNFLEIDFAESLVSPTSLGKPWKGNSSRGIEFSTISAKNLDVWRNEINELEICYINRYFSFILDDFGYEAVDQRRSIWWPVWREGVIAYLANRMIPIYL